MLQSDLPSVSILLARSKTVLLITVVSQLELLTRFVTRVAGSAAGAWTEALRARERPVVLQ